MAKALITALALVLATPVSAETVDQVNLKSAARPVPESKEAIIVLRAYAQTMAGDNQILFYRYDPDKGVVLTGPENKPVGAKLTYNYTIFGGKKGELAVRVAIVPAGTYVLGARTFNLTYTDTFCFGAPRFTLEPGAIVYVGDYELLSLEKMADGTRRNATRYDAELEETRGVFATYYPQLAPNLEAWKPTNGATFRCQGDEFTAYAIPDLRAKVTP